MSLRPKVLVVDDEPQIQRFLRPSLAAVGYDVFCAGSGSEAFRILRERGIDVILLDLGLPDMDGKAIIKKIRETSKVPIIILSAREQEEEKIAALDLGADDYVNKPAAIGELMARIRAALRSAATSIGQATSYASGNLKVDTLTRRAWRDGEQLKLTPKEFDLLCLLVRHSDRVITHQQILSSVWGPAHAEDAQYLRVLVGRLRDKIEDVPRDPRVILTEPGIGYRLAEPETKS